VFLQMQSSMKCQVICPYDEYRQFQVQALNMDSWKHCWSEAQNSPYTHAALTLLALNGLRADQIQQLSADNVDLENGWVTTYDGDRLPLVAQSRTTLMALGKLLDISALASSVSPYVVHESDALRRLSGALWVTNSDHQLILESVDSEETPVLPLRFTFPFSVAKRLRPDDGDEVARRARHALQTAADWLETQMNRRRSPLQSALALLRQGKLTFLVVSTGVSGLNLIHNLLMGRLLSPADYSQLTFIITLQLLIGLFPATLQTMMARFSARYEARQEFGSARVLHRATLRLGWGLGTAVALLLIMLAQPLAALFRISDAALLLPVALALPFFIVTGADRGLLQGSGRYWWLSGAYLGEGLIRLGISVLLGYGLVSAGRSLEGAVWGLAQSMLVTWFIAWVAVRLVRHSQSVLTPEAERTERQSWRQLATITLMALVGQVLITNSDFILVKNFFSPDEAGLYAAISVLGRIVYFGALPLTILLIPLIAQNQALGKPTRPIFMLLIGGGAVVCIFLVAASALFAPHILRFLYGTAYEAAAPLLAPYALAASLYTLTNLAITYQIALGKSGESWMPLLAAVAQIALLLVFHDTLTQVVLVQIVLMGILFAVVIWRVLRSGQSNTVTDLTVASAH
jgi:O-antigen/teichoic acid export membrane protein